MIHLGLTSQCNLRCIYCYASERETSKRNLSLKEILNAIDSINNIAKNATIILTGGEPLLENHAIEVAEYANKNGNQVHLLTNGTLINEDNAKRISKAFHLVQLSIDGSSAEMHDFHRGKGSFRKVTEAIEMLVKNGAFVQISMTITQRNLNDIQNMVKKFGSPLLFAPLFKAGRGRNREDLAITGKEYYKALSSVKGVNPLSYLCSSLERAKQRKILKCAMGDSEISISNTGDVYPCHLLHFPQFLAGNIKKQNLESIYETSEVLKSCRDLTVLKIKECTKCDIRFICGGACRARAFFEKNRIDVSDDFCEYEKQAFINGLFELHYLD